MQVSKLLLTLKLIVKEIIASAKSGTIRKSNCIATGKQLYHEWQISVHLKFEQNTNNGYANVFKLIGKPQSGSPNRLPGAFLRPRQNKLMIQLSGTSSWISRDLGTDWFNLKILHRQRNGNSEFEIKINDDLMITKTEKTDSQMWKNVAVYFARSQPAKGRYQNFKLQTIADNCEST